MTFCINFAKCRNRRLGVEMRSISRQAIALAVFTASFAHASQSRRYHPHEAAEYAEMTRRRPAVGDHLELGFALIRPARAFHVWSPVDTPKSMREKDLRTGQRASRYR